MFQRLVGCILLTAVLVGAPAHAAAPAAQPPLRVTFEIDMREEIRAGRFDPATDRIGVRGAAAPLSWGSTEPALPVGQGRFAASVVFPKPPRGEQPLQYKFKVDRAGQGPSDGWEDGPNRAISLRKPLQTVARAFNSAPEPFPLERTGRIDTIAPLNSRFVEPRAIQVWLPPGYGKDPAQRYPVLYLHDGQTMFDAAFAGAEWRFDEIAQRLSETGAITPPIIVAIENTRQRIDEYTPTSMMMPAARTGLGKDQRMGGGAAKYARYLVEELKPEIDKRYRTLRDAPSTAVGGSSLAGLLSMWLLMHHGDTFGAGLVVSPSVWWDERFIIRDVAAAQGTGSHRPRIWLDIGTEEGKEALPLMRQLRETLHGRGWGNETLAYLEEPEGTHDEASWALRVERMLRFLYGKPPA